jgi:intracellular multiplication protein IcmK
MNKSPDINKNYKLLKLITVAMLAAGSNVAPSFAQEIPDFSIDAASGLPAGPTTPGASPGFGLGPEDDVFGLDDSFDFEKTPQQLEEEIRSQAFNAALEGMLPLRPEEIRILLERYDRTQESVVTPIYPDPKPLSVVETLAMDPGTEPTKIKTGLGHITTLNFIDITGKPWPVQSLSWAGDFEVMQNVGDPEKGENIVRISPRNEFARGNMSIKMIDLDSPIIIMLTTSRDEIHYRFDATVPQRGPMAEVPIIDRGITLTAGRSDISDMLQGVMPNSALKLNVSGVDGRTTAYSFNGMTYLRTPLTLLSPGWINSIASSDGMRVYELQNTPVVLLSEKGKMVRVQLSDREDLLNEQ